MKSAKFYCVSALTALLLMGAGGTVMANDSGAEDNSRVSRVNPVQGERVPIDGDDVEIDGDGLIKNFNNSVKAEKLLAGGHLEVPGTIGSTPVAGIGDYVFSYTSLYNLVNKTNTDHFQKKDSSLPGMSGITFADPQHVSVIGGEAFYQNQISSIDLPVVVKIGVSAFAENQISKVNLPEAVSIGSGAFAENQISDVSLPKVTAIGDVAFISNRIKSLNLSKVQTLSFAAFAFNSLSNVNLRSSKESSMIAIQSNAFYGQNISPTNNGLQLKNSALKANVPHQDPLKWQTITQSIQPSFKINGIEQIKPNDVTINQLETDDQFNKEVENNYNNRQFTNIPKATDLLNKFGIYILYEPSNGVNSESNLNQTINRNSDKSESTKIGNYSTGALVTITNPTTPPTPGPDPEPETEKQPDANNGSSNSTNNNSGNTINIHPVPDLDFPHQSESADKVTTKSPYMIYNKKTIRVHKNKELTSPLKTYRKVARHKAKTFKVLGVAYSKNGVKRYKVAGGYVTAHKDYVANLYYQSTPKRKKIKAIATKGLHKYKDAKLTKKAANSHVSRNKLLKVTKIVTHGNLTRYQLADGTYVSGNKKLVLQQ